MPTLTAPAIVRVAAHCNTCTQTVEFTGQLARPMAAAWADSHYQPTVDEFDVDTPTGIETWRHTS